MKILQISIEVNSGSVGRIAEQIGECIIDEGWESHITFARNHLPSRSQTIKIGSYKDVYLHVLQTRLFDNHCLGRNSVTATKDLVKHITQIDPDIIHLHHLHGYFINIDVLFKHLQSFNKPVIWTFHDCWSFTGHCAHFEFVKCNKWETQCYECPQTKQYPKSILFDRSKKNYIKKKQLFTSLSQMVIVPVSYWLEEKVKRSFLNPYPIKVIQNGIDLSVFSPRSDFNAVKEKYKITKEFVILGVASSWDEKKGLSYFIELRRVLNFEVDIVIVGLNLKQQKELPDSLIGILRTENVDELATLYSLADVFVNPTLEDTFPTTNLEALACGTPVITFRTGGSVESISEDTGFIVEQGNIDGLKLAVDHIKKNSKEAYSKKCRARAELLYNKSDRFLEYIELYRSLISNKS